MVCPNCDSCNFVQLPYGNNWHLCADCCTRWDFDTSSETWMRNFWAEEEWKRMAAYERVGKTYEEAVKAEYEYAWMKQKYHPVSPK